jgi:hypothetical protein
MNFKLFLIFLAIFFYLDRTSIGQIVDITGTDICADGVQSTSVGVSGVKSGAFYALYRNNELVQVRNLASNSKDQSLSYGIFKEIGVYTVAAFEKPVADFPVKSGNPVKGSVKISAIPVLVKPDTLKIKSGEAVNYMPKADIEGTTFSWTANIKYGTATGFSKKGSEAIDDLIKLGDGSPACIVYTITPYSSPYSGSCMGATRDLIVIVNP